MQENKANYFRSPDGEMYAYSGWYRDPLLYSPNGSTFFELHKTGYGGSVEEHTISFENPHHNKTGEIKRLNNEIEVDGKKYVMVYSRPYVSAVSLPTIRKPEYLFALPDGRFIYVSADKYNYSYESFKLFIGPKEEMKEIAIKRVDRLRDGGTTWIETAEGVLYSPSPFKKEIKAKWGDIELEKCELDKFKFLEINLAKLTNAQ